MVADDPIHGREGRWIPGGQIVTQGSSMRLAAKLGFIEVERFQAWDAEQWLGLRPPAT